MGPYGVSAELTAVVALGVLALIMRWVFHRPRRITTRPLDAAESTELGLLGVLASGLSRQEAMQRRAVLGDAGIRSSMSRRRDGTFDVLVFTGDIGRARALLDP
ncbi:MAG TPA: hypothetical protein VGN35_04205 [Jatrophihabitantaceae bacterium]|jgi:hypothetical protein|nr:hypothetical protein [Jatrophihabitantaceae bacterium]